MGGWNVFVVSGMDNGWDAMGAGMIGLQTFCVVDRVDWA